VTDSATFSTTQSEEDLGDLLLDVLPPDGSTMGGLSAPQAWTGVMGGKQVTT